MAGFNMFKYEAILIVPLVLPEPTEPAEKVRVLTDGFGPAPPPPAPAGAYNGAAGFEFV